jgi:hypothetical protein
MRFARIAFHVVSGRQVFRHPCTQDRSYILQKLIAFHQEHETPMKQVLVELENSIEQAENLSDSGFTFLVRPSDSTAKTLCPDVGTNKTQQSKLSKASGVDQLIAEFQS